MAAVGGGVQGAWGVRRDGVLRCWLALLAAWRGRACAAHASTACFTPTPRYPTPPQASDPEFYRAADSLLYGSAGAKPSEAAVDRMVAELNER